MRKAKLLLSTVLSLSMLLTPMYAFAGQNSDAEQELKIHEALQQVNFQTVEVVPGVEAEIVQTATAQNLAVVRTYGELVNALDIDFYDGAFVIYDIEMEDALEVGKDFTIEGLVDDLKIYSASGKRHFKISEDEITLDLSNIVLDGSLYGSTQVSSGGIESVKSCSIVGGTIQNCFLSAYSATGGAIRFIALEGQTLNLSDCKLLNNYASRGGALYAYQGTVVVESCQFTGNQAPSFGGAIDAFSDLSIRNSVFNENLGPISAIFCGFVSTRSASDINSGLKIEIQDSTITDNTGGDAIRINTEAFDHVLFSNVNLSNNDDQNILLFGNY